MHFYEKEVLSVAAGSTMELIEKFNIHSCPNKRGYFFKPSLFITFRNAGGGEMRKLYGVDEVLILNPNDESQLQILSESGSAYAPKLIQYIEERKAVFNFNKAKEYRFYLLSPSNQISLSHGPKPLRNNTGGWYYRLSELLSGKQIVDVDL